MDRCPKCGSTRVYPSRHRGAAERLHQAFTEKRPYRCHNCGWREWARYEVRIPHQADIDPHALRRPRPERPLSGDELDRMDLPERRETARTHSERPLADTELDDIDPAS